MRPSLNWWNLYIRSALCKARNIGNEALATDGSTEGQWYKLGWAQAALRASTMYYVADPAPYLQIWQDPLVLSCLQASCSPEIPRAQFHKPDWSLESPGMLFKHTDSWIPTWMIFTERSVVRPGHLYFINSYRRCDDQPGVTAHCHKLFHSKFVLWM